MSILVLEGEGEFLGRDAALPAKAGDILISEIAEPHGIRAKTRLRVLVTSRRLSDPGGYRGRSPGKERSMCSP